MIKKNAVNNSGYIIHNSSVQLLNDNILKTTFKR
jgi:hypothetical protein